MRLRRGASLGGVLLAVCCSNGAPSGQGRPGTIAGPRPQLAPANAVSLGGGQQGAFDELQRVVADPAGPSLLWLSRGTFRGDLVIRRPLRIVAEQGTTLEGTGNGTVLSIESDDVAIENLTIRHSGRHHTSEDAGVKSSGARTHLKALRVEDALFGIALGPCPDCVVEESEVRGLGQDEELRGDGIKLWEANRSVVRECHVEGARDVVVWYSRDTVLERNLVEKGRYGTHFMYASGAVIRDSEIVNNIVGIFVMYTSHLVAERNVLAGARGSAGVGIGFKESDDVSLRNNWVIANTTGIYLDQTPRITARPVLFERNTIALNEVALRLHSSEEGLAFQDNAFRENVTVAAVEGGGNALGVTFRRNYWSDYAGYDLNRDGIGDVPFELKQLSGALSDAHPSLRFFEGTGAFGIMNAVAQAMPVFAAKKLLVDTAPRMNNALGVNTGVLP